MRNKVLIFLIFKRSRNNDQKSFHYKIWQKQMRLHREEQFKIPTFCHYIQLISRLMFIRNFFPLFRLMNFSCQYIFSVKPHWVTQYGRPWRHLSLLHLKECIATTKHGTSLIGENIYILPPSCVYSGQKPFQYPVWHTLNLVPNQNDTIMSLFSWAHT